MFEGAFERLGRISAKHSGKIIIFWVVLLVVLTPFASLLFSETSYNLGNSITPPDSMAQKALTLQENYFGTNGTASTTSNQTMVIVTTGTDMNQHSTINALITAQNNISSSLQKQGVSSNFSSIIGVENSTLSGVAQFSSSLVNGTYPLIQGVNAEGYQLNQTLLVVPAVIYAIPLNYYANYTYENSFDNYSAYANTSLFIESLNLGSLLEPLAFLYFNTFANYLNYSAAPYLPSTISNSINQTLHNETSQFVSILQNGNPSFLQMARAMNGNFTLSQYESNASQLVYTQDYQNFTNNFVVSFLTEQLSSNTTISGLFSNELNITAYSFVADSYDLGYLPTSFEITNLADGMVANGTISYFAGSPLISINDARILEFVSYVNQTGNPNLSAYSTLTAFSFSEYPAVPSPYVYHQFVGYDNSTVITILTTSVNLTTAQVNTVGNSYQSQISKLGTNTGYYIAGSSALSNQLASESLMGMIRALMIGIFLSVIIVGVFFRSPIAAFLPLAVFGLSAVISLSLNALLYKYLIHGSISFITPTLLLILLLGLSSDYVVYIMARYRRELRSGRDDAPSVTARWAGHAVFTSGITVGLSYVVLWLSGVPIFSDSGITNAIGVIVTIIVANTLLIAILSRGKGRIFWPYKIDGSKHLPAEKGMSRVADIVVKNKGKILVLFLVSTILGGYMYAMTPTNMDVFKLVPSSSGIQAIQAVNSSFNGDLFDRGYVILEFNSPIISGNTYNMSEVKAINAVENALMSSKEVTQVYGPTFPYGQYTDINLSSVQTRFHSEYRSQISSYVGNDSRYAIVDFQLGSLAWESQPSNFVNSIPQVVSNLTDSSYNVYVGGLTESLNDAYTFTAHTFVDMVPILAIAIFLVLLIQISSLFTPIRLISMVFASVIISLALAYIALHLYAGLPILIFLPMFTVITLLAVGLDYDIFMVARVREEVYKGHTDEEGIRTSISENGGVIITLGTLLFATFGSLAFSGIGIIQEIGIGLGFGVLIDTFVSWPFFVPSVMLYLEKFNWWPARIGKTRNRNK